MDNHRDNNDNNNDNTDNHNNTETDNSPVPHSITSANFTIELNELALGKFLSTTGKRGVCVANASVHDLKSE